MLAVSCSSSSSGSSEAKQKQDFCNNLSDLSMDTKDLVSAVATLNTSMIQTALSHVSDDIKDVKELGSEDQVEQHG